MTNAHIVNVIGGQDIVWVAQSVKFAAKLMSEIACHYDSKRIVKQIPFHLSILNTDVILHVILNDDIEVLVCRVHIEALN